MLSKLNFDILAYLAETKPAPTVENIAKHFGFSLDKVIAIFKELTDQGFLTNNCINENGLSALEPYKVKRAIFMAAGVGTRLLPITLNIPKPLIRVNGIRMIDTLLDALLAADIYEIYIIRGYLGEQFDQLLYKYPMIKFIENPFYNKGNNILSVACAGPLIKNSYILEADLVLSNPNLIRKYQYSSNYLAIPVKETDDWCVYLENGLIKQVTHGGKDCYKIVGISYWNECDGVRLVNHIKEVIDTPEGKELLWGQVPLTCYKNCYKVSIRECSNEDIVEIDSFNELKAIDSAYEV